MRSRLAWIAIISYKGRAFNRLMASHGFQGRRESLKKRRKMYYPSQEQICNLDQGEILAILDSGMSSYEPMLQEQALLQSQAKRETSRCGWERKASICQNISPCGQQLTTYIAFLASINILSGLVFPRPQNRCTILGISLPRKRSQVLIIAERSSDEDLAIAGPILALITWWSAVAKIRNLGSMEPRT